MVPSRQLSHWPSQLYSRISAFLPQIVLWFPLWSYSLRSLLCHHSYHLSQIIWSLDSTSPSLCIKLCYWRLKYIFSPLCLPMVLASDKWGQPLQYLINPITSFYLAIEPPQLFQPRWCTGDQTTVWASGLVVFRVMAEEVWQDHPWYLVDGW